MSFSASPVPVLPGSFPPCPASKTTTKGLSWALQSVGFTQQIKKNKNAKKVSFFKIAKEKE
jgi:hypothetical protein